MASISNIKQLLESNSKDEMIVEEQDEKKTIHSLLSKQIIELFESLNSNTNLFSLVKSKSTIEKAGDGLFLKFNQNNNDNNNNSNFLRTGSVLALYRGTSYSPMETMIASQMVFPENDYLFSRLKDRFILDGKTDGPSEMVFQSSKSRESNRIKKLFSNKTFQWKENKLAMAQFVNHSSNQSKVNVVPFDFEFDVQFPQHLIPLIPNVPFQSSEQNILARSVVLISTRPIHDHEELFFDYKLKPSSEKSLPPWYQ